MARTLSEAESKKVLGHFGVRFAPEALVEDAPAAVEAAGSFGYPVAAKLCGENISHKTERALVRLGLDSPAAVAAATDELLAAAVAEDRATGVLVAPMISGDRELIAGIATDEQFGPTVMVGIGGVLAEAIGDVSVRLAPITPIDAREMIEDLESQALLGSFRSQPPVDRPELERTLLALSAAATGATHTGATIRTADINPLIVHEGLPVAVDALVEIAEPS